MTPEELEQVHINYARQFLCTSPSTLNVGNQQVSLLIFKYIYLLNYDKIHYIV